MSGRGPRGPAGPRGQAGPGRGAAAATRVAGPPRGLAGTGGLRLLCPAAGGPGATRVAVATAVTTELVVPGLWLTRARRRTGSAVGGCRCPQVCGRAPGPATRPAALRGLLAPARARSSASYVFLHPPPAVLFGSFLLMCSNLR